MKRISLLLFFIGCFLFSLSATNYFVATNGSDSNSGTIDKPFATLDKAQSKVMAGDTVYIRQGTSSDGSRDNGTLYCGKYYLEPGI